MTKVSRTIQKRIRREGEGIDLAVDVNAAVAGTVNEPGRTTTSVSSRQTVIQRSGRRTEPNPSTKEARDG